MTKIIKNWHTTNLQDRAFGEHQSYSPANRKKNCQMSNNKHANVYNANIYVNLAGELHSSSVQDLSLYLLCKLLHLIILFKRIAKEQKKLNFGRINKNYCPENERCQVLVKDASHKKKTRQTKCIITTQHTADGLKSLSS